MFQDLRLIDVEQVRVFYVSNMWAHVKTWTEAESAMEVPGSFTISSSEKNGLKTNEITFTRSDLTAETLVRLTRLRRLRLIAFYRDGHGQQRVCGSPSWPLTLTFTAEGDCISVKLRGTDTGPDPMLKA